jgi:hypothetical protein
LFKQIKKELMKKLFYVLALAAFATACNNDDKKTADVKAADTTAAIVPVVVDTVAAALDTAGVAK